MKLIAAMLVETNGKLSKFGMLWDGSSVEVGWDREYNLDGRG
jgi:hypothetical protein